MKNQIKKIIAAGQWVVGLCLAGASAIGDFQLLICCIGLAVFWNGTRMMREIGVQEG